MPLVARVVPDVTGVDKVFDYLIPRELEASIQLGDRVRVPLHGRNVPGWVAHIGETDSGFSDVEFSKLRPVIKRLGYGPSHDVIELAEWASQRWCGRLRSLFVAATPKNLITALPSPRYQRERVAVVGDVTIAAAVAGKHSLLVRTGPVKSPMDVLIAAAKSGPTLVIVPTAVRARLFASSLKRHGFSVAVLPDEWAEAAGGVDIAIGSRTAVFSRIPHLASIVVIDEHDDGLKEERTPTWHARDVAVHRSHMLDISCIMMSPLPSIAAVQWANGQILDSPPNERIAEWPTFQIVDRTLDDRWSQSLLSSELIEELHDHSRRIVAIINVKGRARLLACATCKTLGRCESCDAAVEIDGDGLFSCPRCLQQRPQVCLKCGAAKFLVLKPGVSKLREEIARAAGRPLHDVSEVTASMDADDSVDQSKMLFVGTEAALHRVHDVDTVVFLDIDQELSAPRYRSSEIVGSLLVTAARVVGRSVRKGKVMVQTHNAESPILQAVATLQIDEYLQHEQAMRQAMKLPPFGALAQLSGDGVDDVAATLASNVFLSVSASRDGSYLVKAQDWKTLVEVLNALEMTKGVKLKIQVDPARV